MENEGYVLIKGIDLTPEQVKKLPFNGKKHPDFLEGHSFWFKDGLPAGEGPYYKPVRHMFNKNYVKL